MIAVLLVGLAVTTPVVCICVPSDHAGVAIHPLFPHTHPSDIGATASDDHDDAHGSARDFQDGKPLPSLRAEAGSGAASPLAAGALSLSMMHPWTMSMGVVGEAWTPLVRTPRSIARPPQPPPPR